jgi:hypothetical protein
LHCGDLAGGTAKRLKQGLKFEVGDFRRGAASRASGAHLAERWHRLKQSLPRA